MLRLAYILSASHSGSTLLAMLAGSHPRVFTVGEIKATNLGDVQTYRCSCGVCIGACGFWRKVSEAMAARDCPFTITDARTDFRNVGSRYADWLLRPLVRDRFVEFLRDAALWVSPSWRRALPEIQRRNLALVDSLCALTGAEVIVDSSKIALRLKYLLRIRDLDVRVIRLIRDGRGVAFSHLDPARYADAQDPELRGGGNGGDRRDERLSIAQAAYEWRRSNEEAENILGGLERSRWMQVRYEDLCRYPKATLLEVFSFLGVDPAGAAWDFRSTDHHVLGNGMRLDRSPDIVLDDRWKSVLTEPDLMTFEAVAGEMNHRYGYT